MERIKMKTKDIVVVKQQLFHSQGGICPLCKANMQRHKPVNIVLDHCHERGHVRAALCRNCNGMLGKVEGLASRSKRNLTKEQWLQNCIDFLILHRKPQTHWIHPKHFSPDELREKRNKKARSLYAKRKAALLRQKKLLTRGKS